MGVGAVVDGDAARPHAGLVEHDALAFGIAEKHRAQTSVADGAGLGEMKSGCLEAQHLRRRSRSGRRSACHMAAEKDGRGGDGEASRRAKVVRSGRGEAIEGAGEGHGSIKNSEI